MKGMHPGPSTLNPKALINSGLAARMVMPMLKMATTFLGEVGL